MSIEPTNGNHELSEEEKARLNELADTIFEHLKDPECRETIERLQSVVSRIQDRVKTQTLTRQEHIVITFIKKKRKTGESASLREMAVELGYKSSRSAFQLVDGLIKKGILRRSEMNGLLEIVEELKN